MCPFLLNSDILLKENRKFTCRFKIIVLASLKTYLKASVVNTQVNQKKIYVEAATRGVLYKNIKKLFLKFSQYLQENACAGICF